MIRRACQSFSLIVAVILLAACSIQKTYYDADMGLGIRESRSGNLLQAEQHYVSAVWRAKNHLGDKEISWALYNYGQNLRLQGRYELSVESHFESINYALKAGTFDELAMGQKYAEIAASYAGLGRWKSGAQYVKRLVPIWEKYTGKEAAFLQILFSEYKKNLAKLGEDTSFIP